VSDRADPRTSGSEAGDLAPATAAASFDARLGGVFAPICTPFAEDESVDDDALRENMARYAVSGLLAYLALGSNAENRSLTEEERLLVLDTIARHQGEGQVVMAGATYDSQRDT
jgi:4-hydroxy-2-oxoglutarate aldolase